MSEPEATGETERQAGQPATVRYALVVLAALAFVLMLLLVPVPFHGRAATALGDFVHAPLFASLALGTLWIWQRLRPQESVDLPWMRCLVVWLVLSVFGLVMEFVQGMMGRTAAWHDVQANSLGAAAALGLVISFRCLKRNQRMQAALATAFSVTLLILAWMHPFNILRDVMSMQSDFPLLASFETEAELTRWYCHSATVRRVVEGATEGDHALQVTYLPGGYPAITLVDMMRDWSAATAIELDVMLDSEHDQPTVMLMLKVIDLPHQDQNMGAFVKTLELRRGERTRVRLSRDELVAGSLEAGAGDSLDLSQIVYLDVALVDAANAVVVTIDRLTLLTE